ncbi:MAG TPA: antitoxin family protein [Tepidisphaeraceae bacterium]|nr:antitoxin family protein [Tepidisphaeraceae bacterium]
MTLKVHAIFERGVFRPTSPVTIAEGMPVELTVDTPAPTTAPGGMAAALAEIASLPPGGPADGFSGADHDRVLYPRETKR